jgi:3',5'-nucleoside bisphosphate phosphatase
MLRIDLHTHSNRSDGTDSPTQLVHNAKRVGLDVIGLSDHDSTQGWDEAQLAATEVGLQLVRGVEISTTFKGKSVHLLGYGFDPRNRELLAEFARIIDGRNNRLPHIVEALQHEGIPITVEQVNARSSNAAATGRPHVADVLVDLGVVASRDEAFANYLTPGRPGYVERYGVDLHRAIELVRAAGGRTVLAHPWARDSKRVLTADHIAWLAELGLAGIEVDHNDHEPEARRQLRGLADELGLVKTGSSDYHGTGKSAAFALGCNTTDPAEFEKLFND